MFFMYLQILDHTKPQNPVVFWGFWELDKNRSIFMKNGSRTLKSRYLRHTFLLSSFAAIELWSWNLAKLENKLVQKKSQESLFLFSTSYSAPYSPKLHIFTNMVKIFTILTRFEHYFFIGKFTEKGDFRHTQPNSRAINSRKERGIDIP